MLQGLKNGLHLTHTALFTVAHHPSLIAPLLLCWAFHATSVGYLKFFFDWDAHIRSRQLAVALGFVAALTLLLTFCCLALLALYRQLEDGQRPRLLAAVGEALGLSMLRALPVTLIWSAVWLGLGLADRLVSGSAVGENLIALTAENIARTVAGVERLQLSSLVAVAALLRMLAFFVIAAVAWDDLPFTTGLRRGLSVVSEHKVEFAVGFFSIQLVTALLFLPAGILFLLSAGGVRFPEWVWLTTVGASGLIWSLLVYLEQMFAALLYQWHRTWEQECVDAAGRFQQVPGFHQIAPPQLRLTPARA